MGKGAVPTPRGSGCTSCFERSPPIPSTSKERRPATAAPDKPGRAGRRRPRMIGRRAYPGALAKPGATIELPADVAFLDGLDALIRGFTAD